LGTSIECSDKTLAYRAMVQAYCCVMTVSTACCDINEAKRMAKALLLILPLVISLLCIITAGTLTHLRLAEIVVDALQHNVRKR